MDSLRIPYSREVDLAIDFQQVDWQDKRIESKNPKLVDPLTYVSDGQVESLDNTDKKCLPNLWHNSNFPVSYVTTRRNL